MEKCLNEIVIKIYQQFHSLQFDSSWRKKSIATFSSENKRKEKKMKEIIYLVFRLHKNHKIIIKPRTLVQIEKNITKNSQKHRHEIAQRMEKNEDKMM